MDLSAARPAAKPIIPTNSEQYLTFQLAGQTYGVEILRVQEIKGWRSRRGCRIRPSTCRV